jgi:hypothetical protein
MPAGSVASRESLPGSSPMLAIRGSKTVGPAAAEQIDRRPVGRVADRLDLVLGPALARWTTQRAAEARAESDPVVGCPGVEAHVWATASARATIGGPNLESRTACSSASFQRTATFAVGAALARGCAHWTRGGGHSRGEQRQATGACRLQPFRRKMTYVSIALLSDPVARRFVRSTVSAPRSRDIGALT